ncbi:MAG: ATP-binding cassette domain-containing protein, partial [Chloroflexota bacterium]|nr:ATP-binding cassette domain-containing protein [Chloroflexota bacterium]
MKAKYNGHEKDGDRNILIVRDVHKHFGGVKAVNGVSLEVERGSITGLIGPNGAGKSTTFNIIAGYYKPDAGEIVFDGERIDGLAPHEIFHKGLARTFQITRELKLMTVLENLMLVPPRQHGENLFRTWFSPGRVREQERELRQKALDVLEFVDLLHVKDN